MDAEGRRMRLGETANPGCRERRGANGDGRDCDGLADLTPGPGMAHEGGSPARLGLCAAPSGGQPHGGPLAVLYPCTGDRVERQVAGLEIS